jgi:hypothetical protein
MKPALPASDCRRRAVEFAQKALGVPDPDLRLTYSELAEQRSRAADLVEELEKHWFPYSKA